MIQWLSIWLASRHPSLLVVSICVCVCVCVCVGGQNGLPFVLSFCWREGPSQQGWTSWNGQTLSFLPLFHLVLSWLVGEIHCDVFIFCRHSPLLQHTPAGIIHKGIWKSRQQTWRAEAAQCVLDCLRMAPWQMAACSCMSMTHIMWKAQLPYKVTLSPSLMIAMLWAIAWSQSGKSNQFGRPCWEWLGRTRCLHGTMDHPCAILDL